MSANEPKADIRPAMRPRSRLPPINWAKRRTELRGAFAPAPSIGSAGALFSVLTSREVYATCVETAARQMIHSTRRRQIPE
jgi:hypothetical protein